MKLLAFLVSGVISFSWDANPPEQNVTSYNVYVATPRGVRGSMSWDFVASVASPGYTATGLTSGRIYVFGVTAQNPFSSPKSILVTRAP